MKKNRINKNKNSLEIEKEILLYLMDIKSYSKSALYCLKNDDLTNIDKNEVIAYFSTIPSLCKKIELQLYELELAIKLESDNYVERL